MAQTRLELLRAIDNFDSTLLAEELVVSTLINILKSPPTADVKKENSAEIGIAGPDVLNQFG